MRKIVSLFTAFILLMLLIPTFTAASASGTAYERINTFEALSNADFEQGTASWTYEGTAGSMAASDANVYSGEKSLYINTTKTSYVSQQISAEVGDNLIFRVYSKTESYASNSAYTFVSVEIWGDGVKTEGKTLNKRINATADWTEFRIELVVPEKSEYVLVKLGTSGGKVYFDNSNLLKIPAVIAYEKPDLTPINPNENLVVNPGFETVTDSAVENWEPYYATRFGAWGANEYTTLATDIVKSGNNSLHIQGLGGRYPNITQKLTNIEPLAQYKLTIFVYSTESVVCTPQLQLCNESGTVLKSLTNLNADVSRRPLNTWYELTTYFTVADVENTSYIQLSVNTYGNCDIYVDDISLYKVSEPAACSIETDEWFYYTEWDGGTADIVVSDKILNENPEGSAKVYIKHKDGNTVLAEKTYSPLTKKIAYSFKTEELSPSYGDVFFVYADFYDKDGQFIDSHKEYFCYYSRPENLTEDGKWFDNYGNPFDPVIGNYGSEETIKYASESGVNVVTIGYTRNPQTILQQLDLCEKYGIMAIVHLYSNSNACGKYPLDTMAAVEAAKDHPATFGYAVQDEPKSAANPTAGLRISYQLIRDIDRKHPVYYVESNISFSEDQLKLADFLCVDVYSAARGSYASYVAPYMIELAEAKPLNHNKPTAAIIQTYEWQDYYPTVEEARHMTYQVMFAGVDTAGYYHLAGVLEDETFAEGLAKFNLEELPLIYKLFHTDECKVIASDTDSASKVWYYSWRDGAKTYIAAINRDPNAARIAQFTGLVKPEKLTKTFGDTTDSSILYSGNNVTLSIAPGACVMYEYEEKAFPHEETFVKDGYTRLTDAVWSDAEGTEYSHPLHVPTGWSWRVTDTTDSYSQAAHTTEDHRRATVTTASDNITYLGMTGNDVAITKMVDIIPGYSYTLTADAYTLSSQARSALSYTLYHKNSDGTYTEINEYLSKKHANPLETTSETAVFNAANGTTVTWNGNNAALKGTLSLNFEVTDSSVNAIMVSLGGYGGNSDHQNFRVYHPGFTLRQGNAVDLVQNTTYFVDQSFTANGYEAITATWADAEGTEYDHPLHIPTGWDWRVTSSENGVYYQAVNTQTARQRSVMYTASDNVTYLGMSGTDLAITKMVDIDPGYYYTLTTNAYTKAGDGRTALSYWFYHKNEDGTYTEINDYLLSQGKEAITNTHSYISLNVGKNGTATTWNGGSAKMGTLTQGFSVTNKYINAVMIGLGGYGGNSDHSNFRVYHDGFKIAQVDKLNITTEEDVTPPALMLAEKDGMPIVRYAPVGTEEVPTIVIAVYTKKADGALRLEKVSLTKPQPTAKGYYEAEYTPPEDENAVVKAFVWNTKKQIPFVESLTIQ